MNVASGWNCSPTSTFSGAVWARVSMRERNVYTARSRSRCSSRSCSKRLSAAPDSLAARTCASSSGSRSPAKDCSLSATSSASACANWVRWLVEARVSSCRASSSSAEVTWLAAFSSAAIRRTTPSRLSAMARSWAMCSRSAASKASRRSATSSRIASRRSAASSAAARSSACSSSARVARASRSSGSWPE